MARAGAERSGLGILALGLLWLGVGVGSCLGREPRPRPQDLTPPALALRAGPVPGRPHARIRGAVLVVVDTLRADHVGAYAGPGRDPASSLTPALDRLAAEGVRFAQAAAPSAWTRPSVAAILSGRHPGAMGVLGLEDAIAPEETMLAERLSAAGIQTLGVSSNGNAGAAYGFDQGFDHFVVPEETRGYEGDVQVHDATGVTRLAEHLLDGLSPDRPFFLFLHYVDPHDPYLPHPELMHRPEPSGRFDGSRKELQALDVAQQYVFAPGSVPPDQRPTPDDYARIRFLYDGEVRFVDLWLGKLFDSLRERGLWDDVLCVVTADHGEGLWDHLRRGHGYDLYQEQVHVPLLVHGPGWPAGRVVTEPVSLVDITPTLLAQFGLDTPVEVQGSDLAPLVRGQDRGPGHDSVYSELHRDPGNHLRAVRVGRRKLIARVREQGYFRYELYDLKADPKERVNRYGARGLGGPELEVRMQEWARVLAERATASRSLPLDALDPGTRTQLEALGYVDPATGRPVRGEGR